MRQAELVDDAAFASPDGTLSDSHPCYPLPPVVRVSEFHKDMSFCEKLLHFCRNLEGAMPRRLILVGAAVATIGYAQTGRITGTVQTADGSPVVNTRVVLIRSTAPTFAVAAYTSDDGSFDAPDLPAGVFRLCPDLPSSDYISPCLWHDPNAIVQLAEGQRVDGVSLILKTGVTLSVTVDDPVGVLQKAHATGTPPPMLFLAVKGPKKVPLPLLGGTKDGATTTYQLNVPVDTPLQLFVYPVGVSVVDQNGLGVPEKGRSYDFVQSSPLAKSDGAQRSKAPGKGSSEAAPSASFSFTVNEKH